MKSIFYTISIVFCTICYGQDFKDRTVTPPSPTAYELGKYGNVDVGLFTGTPNVNIPICNYQAGTISVPISLSYSSNGIYANQLSTNVGLGWSLNAGGVITRITRGRPDDLSNPKYARNDIANMDIYTPIAAEYFFNAAKDNTDTETDLFMYNFQGYSGKFVYGSKGEILCIPKNNLSITRYSEDDKTGFIVITPEGTKYLFYEKEESFTRQIGNAHTPPSLPVISSWFLSEIITPSNRLQFIYVKENYSFISNVSQVVTIPIPGEDGLPACGVSGPVSVSIGPFVKNRLQTNEIKLLEIKSDNELHGKITFNYDKSHPEISGLDLVTGINIIDDNSITIDKFDLEYLFTENKRVFLKKIITKDVSKTTYFDYIQPNEAKKRLSGEDYFGLANNSRGDENYFPVLKQFESYSEAVKNAIVPYANRGQDRLFSENIAKQGLLEKITFPTKGFTFFEYEPNSKTIGKTKQVNQDRNLFGLQAYFPDGGTPTKDFTTYKPKKDIRVFISGSASSTNGDQDGPKGNTPRGGLRIYDKTVSKYLEGGSYSNVNAPQEHTVVLEKDHLYEFELIAGLGSYVSIGAKELRPSKTVVFYENFNIGNFRIKKMIKNDRDKDEVTRYYYGEKERYRSSSIIPLKEPSYYTKRVREIKCSEDPEDTDLLTELVINSMPVLPLFKTTKYKTPYYKYVTVSHGGDNFENGGTEHKFNIGDLDITDYGPDYVKGPFTMRNIPWVNRDWKTGLLESKTHFRVTAYDKDMDKYSIKTLKKELYNYFENPDLKDEVYGHALSVNYPIDTVEPINYNCTEADKIKSYNRYECRTRDNHKKHIWSLLPFDGIDGWRCINRGNDNKEYTYKHPCNPNGGLITYYTQIDNLSIAKYKTISHRYYLSSKSESIYDDNGENPITTTIKYKYDNPTHLQVTETTVSTSNSDKILKSKTFYPDDVTSVSSLGNPVLEAAAYNSIKALQTPSINNQEALHQIGQPVQTITKVISNVIETKQTQRTLFKKHNGMVLPKFIKTLKGTYSNSNTMQTRLTYHEYDDNGNLLEVSKPNGTHTIYIWGYNKTYPIAKIKNATYAQVSGYVSSIQSKSNTDTDRTVDVISKNGYKTYVGKEGILRKELNKLRTSLNNALVTTYTYDPLIGVTSITDPRGNTIYYDYDSFNRLKYTKDLKGNILMKNEYNYAKE